MIIERIPLPRAVPGSASLNGMAAAAEFEKLAQVALFDQTVRVTLDGWPCRAVMALPIAPVLDPLSVAITADGEPFESYAIITGQRPALRLTGARPSGLVVIEYTAGFGDAMDDLPADIRQAIQDQAAVQQDVRGARALGRDTLSPHMARVVARYRRVSV